MALNNRTQLSVWNGERARLYWELNLAQVQRGDKAKVMEV
jgi:hypothetical protein